MIGLREWKYCTIHSDRDPDVILKHPHGTCLLCEICKMRIEGSMVDHIKEMHRKVEKDG